MKKKEVLDTLKLDQILINESFRRLVEGICCLKFEDQDYAWDLFNKAAQAVREHIKIEEEGLLDKVAIEEATVMRSEHRNLIELLEEARYALREKRAVSFKVLIAALKTAMIEHERIESHLFRSLELTEFSHDILASLQRRIANRIV